MFTLVRFPLQFSIQLAFQHSTPLSSNFARPENVAVQLWSGHALSQAFSFGMWCAMTHIMHLTHDKAHECKHTLWPT